MRNHIHEKVDDSFCVFFVIRGRASDGRLARVSAGGAQRGAAIAASTATCAAEAEREREAKAGLRVRIARRATRMK